MVIFPNCKINLGLHILRKRSDGFHDLETVFYPVPLQDALEIMPQATSFNDPVRLSVSGDAIDVPPTNNICYKAYGLLKADFPALPPVQMHLHKLIPSGAGLGGGSADGAFTLLLLNSQFGLGLSEAQLMEYALQLGSDCPFFIRNRPAYALGRGERLEDIPLDLSGWSIVLVNPRIHVNTGWAFSRIKPTEDRPAIKEIVSRPVQSWKGELINDFEEVVMTEHPPVRAIRDALYEQGAAFAAMSGSGSTVFGLFPKTLVFQSNFPAHYFIRQV